MNHGKEKEEKEQSRAAVEADETASAVGACQGEELGWDL